MLIIPAIDLKDGKCVRLVKGREGTETVFSDDPIEVARRWEGAGAGLVHVVDLDGAFAGEPRNFDLICSIARSISAPVQVGGGVRDIETVGTYISAGLGRVVLGTAAINDRAFLMEACAAYPGKIALGLDTSGGRIAVKGWTELLDLDIADFLDGLSSVGVSVVIHTDVDRDGTLAGVKAGSIETFIRSSPVPVVASGGVAAMEDLEALHPLERCGLTGVILGRSIYTGAIDLKSAIERFSDAG